MTDEPTIRELKPGETIRVSILAGHWIDVTHDGWYVRCSSPRGVEVKQEARNELTVHTRDPIEDDEL